MTSSGLKYVFKKNCPFLNRLARALQSEKVLKLKEELEAKLDSWRKQLLQVQTMSIRKAEERFKMALQKKKTKVATDTVNRTNKHNLLFDKVQYKQADIV